MVVRMNINRTDDAVVVPEELADAVTRAIEGAAEPHLSLQRVFPEGGPETALRGARGLRGLTQAGLGTLIGVRASHISDMENGRRPIGKEMAKKLGQALDFPWKSFV